MRVKHGDLYVSAVEGHIVARFGSARNGLKAQAIGVYPVTRTNEKGEPVFEGMRWDPKEVVRIPRESYIANLKDYDRALADKALKRRTKEDFDAFMSAILAEEKKATAELEKAAAAAKEQAAKDAAEDEAADKAAEAEEAKIAEAPKETTKPAASAAAGKQE